MVNDSPQAINGGVASRARTRITELREERAAKQAEYRALVEERQRLEAERGSADAIRARYISKRTRALQGKISSKKRALKRIDSKMSRAKKAADPVGRARGDYAPPKGGLDTSRRPKADQLMKDVKIRKVEYFIEGRKVTPEQRTQFINVQRRQQAAQRKQAQNQALAEQFREARSSGQALGVAGASVVGSRGEARFVTDTGAVVGGASTFSALASPASRASYTEFSIAQPPTRMPGADRPLMSPRQRQTRLGAVRDVFTGAKAGFTLDRGATQGVFAPVRVGLQQFRGTPRTRGRTEAIRLASGEQVLGFGLGVAGQYGAGRVLGRGYTAARNFVGSRAAQRFGATRALRTVTGLEVLGGAALIGASVPAIRQDPSRAVSMAITGGRGFSRGYTPSVTIGALRTTRPTGTASPQSIGGGRYFIQQGSTTTAPATVFGRPATFTEQTSVSGIARGIPGTPDFVLNVQRATARDITSPSFAGQLIRPSIRTSPFLTGFAAPEATVLAGGRGLRSEALFSRFRTPPKDLPLGRGVTVNEIITARPFGRLTRTASLTRTKGFPITRRELAPGVLRTGRGLEVNFVARPRVTGTFFESSSVLGKPQRITYKQLFPETRVSEARGFDPSKLLIRGRKASTRPGSFGQRTVFTELEGGTIRTFGTRGLTRGLIPGTRAPRTGFGTGAFFVGGSSATQSTRLSTRLVNEATAIGSLGLTGGTPTSTRAVTRTIPGVTSITGTTSRTTTSTSIARNILPSPVTPTRLRPPPPPPPGTPFIPLPGLPTFGLGTSTRTKGRSTPRNFGFAPSLAAFALPDLVTVTSEQQTITGLGIRGTKKRRTKRKQRK